MKLALLALAAVAAAAIVRDYRRVMATIDEAVEKGRCREWVMLDG